MARISSANATAAGLTFRQVRRSGMLDHVATLPTSVKPDPYYSGIDRCTQAVVWYDHNIRLWTGWLADDNGCQYTEAVYGVTSTDAADEVTRLYRTRLP